MYYNAPQVQPRNGIGTAALTLGIVGLVLSFVPFIGLFGFILGILAVIFGIVGGMRGRKGQATNPVVAWVGLGLGAAAIVISTVVFGWLVAWVGEGIKNADVNQSGGGAPSRGEGALPGQNAPKSVRYELAGQGRVKDIHYGEVGAMQEDSRGAQLPWGTEEQDAKGFNAYTLTAQKDNTNGAITCRIVVDGEVVQEATSQGGSAFVSCNGNSGF